MCTFNDQTNPTRRPCLPLVLTTDYLEVLETLTTYYLLLATCCLLLATCYTYYLEVLEALRVAGEERLELRVVVRLVSKGGK